MRQTGPLIGYHFTPYETWQKIQAEGLKLRLTWKEDIGRYFPQPIPGIWIYTRPLTPKETLFATLAIAGQQASLRIVKLEVKYTADQVLSYDGRNLLLQLKVSLDNLACYRRLPAKILTTRVDPSDIRLLEDFNLMDLVTA